jgi:hypothetical protein
MIFHFFGSTAARIGHCLRIAACLICQASHKHA